MNILSQFLLGILNITYVSLDFKISDRAVDSFHDVKDWRLSDRDFGLTLSADGIHALVTSDGNLNALTPQYIQNKMMNVVSKGFQHDRVGHLRLGMVIDLLSLMIATLLFTRAVLQILKWKPLSVNCPVCCYPVSYGPELTLAVSIFHRNIRTLPLHSFSICYHNCLCTSQLGCGHKHC